ncbi:Lateral organ boundaries, LOB [Dillenia turbinata]|uniref:Lateral organ boundaries, LOB n=1 Tax=Dillenia turbinata TaxID=194707 RepID=A0AAN8W486_9MAGN
MSCNGCRVLRKGCSENCVLRSCLQWIGTPEAQGHATVFVAKFFGRAGLMSFLSAVPESQRPALFQSLLLEACGRTVSPITGAVGLLWTGNWHICQLAMETVLKGGSLNSIYELVEGIPTLESNGTSQQPVEANPSGAKAMHSRSRCTTKRRTCEDVKFLRTTSSRVLETNGVGNIQRKRQRLSMVCMSSEESETTTVESGSDGDDHSEPRTDHKKTLRLFF